MSVEYRINSMPLFQLWLCNLPSSRQCVATWGARWQLSKQTCSAQAGVTDGTTCLFLAHSPSLINALWVLNAPPVMAMSVINSWWWTHFQESEWLSFSYYFFFTGSLFFASHWHIAWIPGSGKGGAADDHLAGKLWPSGHGSVWGAGAWQGAGSSQHLPGPGDVAAVPGECRDLDRIG